MIKRYKLDKSFGSVASFAGILILISGLGLLFYSSGGLILILIGAFIGFTSTSTSINFDTGKLKHSLNLFGIFDTGKWISLEPEMKLGIIKSNKVWCTYSRGNRTLDITDKDTKIYLFNADDKPLIPIKKIEKPDAATSELEALRGELGLTAI